ncbi:putative mucin/carbohydrate-binding domain-containing protein [Bacillus thuringiensis]
MISQKTKKRFNKVIIMTAACSMFSMFGTSISHTKAATHSAAPAVYVSPKNIPASDIISIDWSPVQTPPYTYWAVHNWNAGGEAGGYAGFQQQSGFDENGKRTLHFALWDPISSKEAIKAEYLSPNSQAGPFGGEGTGMKVQTTYGWKDYNWYTMTMRSWQENGHTKFGQWMKDVTKNKWHQIAIMDFPVANVAFNHGLGMFQEDWADSGQNVREARLKNGYSRKLVDKQWSSWNNQSISGTHDNTYQYDGGSTSEYVWVKAGGNTQSTIGSGKIFTLNQPTQPEIGKLDFDIQSIYYENEKLNVFWKLKENSTPQFKGKIEIYNNENMTGQPINVINDIKSYQNVISQSISLPTNAYAKIVLTDIFDQTVEKKVQIKNESPNIFEGNEFAWSLKGIGDFEFAKVNLNKSTEEMQIDLKAGVPHDYFDSTYASIKVQNTSGKVVYNKEIYGNKQQNAESQKVPVKVGDYIELTHLEGVHRATLTNVDNSKQESFGKKAIYEVTKEGLKKVEKMPEATILEGNKFAWSLKGYSDREIAKVDYDKTVEEMKVKLEAGVPHSYFASTYASIKVQNSSGNVLYNKEIVGNKQQNAESQTVPVKVGDYIEFTHIEGEATKEKTRAILINLENNKNETIGKTARYQVTKEGLKKVEKMPETTVLDGNHFGWSLKGYSDREIAKVDYNKTTEKMQVNLEAGVPHSYFNNTYASITVKNSTGSILYNKGIVGNRQQNAESQTVPVKVGDYIEFTHIEGEAVKEKTRAILINLENNKQEYMGKKRTYQVTSTGLNKIE